MADTNNCQAKIVLVFDMMIFIVYVSHTNFQ